MNILELEKHIRIVKNSEELLKHIGKCDFLETLMLKSSKAIEEYNKSNLKVVNITDIENGKWKSTLKKIIASEYVRKIKDKNNAQEKEDTLCEKCIIKENNNEFINLKDCEPKCQKLYYEIVEFNEKIRKKNEEIHYEFMKAIENTKMDDDLKEKYILLMRIIKNNSHPTDLEKSIKQSIRVEILKTFEEQNKKLIFKYN